MSTRVHPTAVIDDGAALGDQVEIGPHCIVGDGVRLGEGTQLISHCVILGPTIIGRRNVIHPFAVIGNAPQDRSYRGEKTSVLIGDDNVIREHVTIHRGTCKGGGITTIGSGALLMVGSHVAHDVVVEDNVTLTNGTLLGGHVRIGSWAVTAGHVAVAPFVRVGESAFLAGGAMVERDVPPFMIAAGDRARVRALNRVGLERRGVPEASRRTLKQAFKILYLSGEPMVCALARVEASLGADPLVAQLVAFIREAQGRA